MNKIFKDRSVLLFLVLGGFFITNALLAEFIGVKIFSLERTFGFEPFSFDLLGEKDLGFNLTAGVLLWPVVFVMTDVINEYYGKRGVKILSFGAVFLIIFAFIVVYLAINLVPNDWWANQSGLDASNPTQSIANMDVAFKKIFGQGLWIIFGSLVAFLIGQFVDVMVFQRIKSFTGDNKIWLRATGSTLISQLIDSYVVLFIAFYFGADWSLGRVTAIANVNYIYKFSMAIILTPVIYMAHYFIDMYLGKSLSQRLKKQALNN